MLARYTSLVGLLLLSVVSPGCAKEWKVNVKAVSPDAQSVVSNLLARIGSSSKYRLAEEKTADVEVLVNCLQVRSQRGMELGLACYETVIYIPFVDKHILMNTFIGSTSAVGGAQDVDYLGRVLFEDLVGYVTDDNLNSHLLASMTDMKNLADQLGWTDCPKTQKK